MSLLTMIPGLRDVRTHLVAGYAWLLVIWIDVAPDDLSVRPTDRKLASVYDLVEAIGPAGAAVATGVVAYLLGAVILFAVRATLAALVTWWLMARTFAEARGRPPGAPPVPLSSWGRGYADGFAAGLAGDTRPAVRGKRQLPPDLPGRTLLRIPSRALVARVAASELRDHKAALTELKPPLSGRVAYGAFRIVWREVFSWHSLATYRTESPHVLDEVSRIRSEAMIRFSAAPPAAIALWQLVENSQARSLIIIGAVYLVVDGLSKALESNYLLLTSMEIGLVKAPIQRDVQELIQRAQESQGSGQQVATPAFDPAGEGPSAPD